MKSYIDVTNEYLGSDKKCIGNISYEDNYNIKEHTEEIDMALWLHNNFGGDINLLIENNRSYGIKRSDYEWNGKYWELKSLSSEKAIDSALRKAISQIYVNPGGVILDFGKNKIDLQKIYNKIEERISTSCRFKIDIMIINYKKLLKVIRFE